MEYRIRRQERAWRWIFNRGAPMYGGDGEFAGLIGSCTDVTERVEAQAALAAAQAAQTHTLHGLLPICTFCKKIKNDQGYWEVLEHYIHEHSEADFSHGLCPDCFLTYLSRMTVEAGTFGAAKNNLCSLGCFSAVPYADPPSQRPTFIYATA